MRLCKANGVDTVPRGFGYASAFGIRTLRIIADIRRE
jgi:hypothetical protein